MIQHMYHFLILAEGMRFELMRGFPLLAFQASALDHYANPPRFANVSFTISESKEKSKFFSDHPFALLRPLVSFAIFNEPFRPFPGLWKRSPILRCTHRKREKVETANVALSTNKLLNFFIL